MSLLLFSSSKSRQTLASAPPSWLVGVAVVVVVVRGVDLSGTLPLNPAAILALLAASCWEGVRRRVLSKVWSSGEVEVSVSPWQKKY